jgi:hypothetical protein
MTDESVKYEIYDDGAGAPPMGPVGVEGRPTNTLSATTQSVDPDAMTQRVAEYVRRVKPKIWILTPCYGGMCHISYVQSMISSMGLFDKLGVRYHFEFCKNDSLITRARNNLIAKAMTDPDMTHMIFIDNDITWKAVDLVRMMVCGKEFVGGIYPIKNYDWSRLVKDPLNPFNTNVVKQWIDTKNRSEIGKFFADEEIVQANMLKYNVNYLTANLQIMDNLTQVRHVPTGFMMLQRSVILKMQREMADKKYVDDVSYLTEEESKNAYALFDCMVKEGHYFSEDWYFCEKWREMGGEIWADVSVNLVHTGMEDYRGSFIGSLMMM